MSEPQSAFLKFKTSREVLARWLDAKPSLASRWHDWREIGGEWYLARGVTSLATATDADLAETLGGADQRLASFADNRELLTALVTHTAEAPELWVSAFDQAGEAFVAGSLTYSENLEDFIVFLAVARGVADDLDPADHGLAVIHNYLWGGEEEQNTTAAVQMTSGASSLLPKPKQPDAASAFLPIVDALLGGQLPSGFSTRDELALLN
ncbi:hypothetical protein FXN63_18000 [Pigmentiphaga aceris]|uniref:Uncharacterized protein n=1 Tax=Pigmentiphaga aceris TaxID=1940612 RepID=A0A5C0B2U6_9BURK|nr:hypothetical protein [Pigmentiphaga aceris]QEI07520.1 hypothetical protein FXN63_18000 [Pigmentiphaga aceris]